MKGMELSRRFWQEVLSPAMERDFPALFSHTAAGLVGNGSECFGFDDKLSRDHDWGTEVMLWLPEDSAPQIPGLLQWKRTLLERHPEYPQCFRVYSGEAEGVMTCRQFYKRLLGLETGPHTVREWFSVPEEALAMAVNGAVFYDGPGEFTTIREHLQAGRPEDLRRKRIAARCMMLAQTGQYNLERCIRREAFVSAATTCAKFVEEAIWLVFLLNRTYKPYYKWEYPAMRRLPWLADAVGPLLEELTDLGGWSETACRSRLALAEKICAIFAAALRQEGLSDAEDPFLAVHGQSVQSRIQDLLLSRLPPQVG